MDELFAVEKEHKKYEAIIETDAARRAAASAAQADFESEAEALEKFLKQLEAKKSDLKSHIATLDSEISAKEAEKKRAGERGKRMAERALQKEALSSQITEAETAITEEERLLAAGQRQRDIEMNDAQGRLATAEAAAEVRRVKMESGGSVGGGGGGNPLSQSASASSSSSAIYAAAGGKLRRRGSAAPFSGSVSNSVLSSVPPIESLASLTPADVATQHAEASAAIATLQRQIAEAEKKRKENEDDDGQQDSAAAGGMSRAEAAAREVHFNQLSKLRKQNQKLEKERDLLAAQRAQLAREAADDEAADEKDASDRVARILLTIRPDEWKLVYLRGQLEQREATIAALRREVATIPRLEAQIAALQSELVRE